MDVIEFVTKWRSHSLTAYGWRAAPDDLPDAEIVARLMEPYRSADP
jgi:hypothetical protein